MPGKLQGLTLISLGCRAKVLGLWADILNFRPPAKTFRRPAQDFRPPARAGRSPAEAGRSPASDFDRTASDFDRKSQDVDRKAQDFHRKSRAFHRTSEVGGRSGCQILGHPGFGAAPGANRAAHQGLLPGPPGAPSHSVKKNWIRVSAFLDRPGADDPKTGSRSAALGTPGGAPQCLPEAPPAAGPARTGGAKSPMLQWFCRRHPGWHA